MREISALAIVVGGVCDVVLSSVLAIPLVVYTVSTRGFSHLPREQLQSAVTTAIHGAPGLYAMQLGIGLGCSVLGGFIAASIAKHRHLLNGMLASWLCVGIGIYSLASGGGVGSVPVRVGLIAVTPLCYLVGAHLRLRMLGAGGAMV